MMMVIRTSLKMQKMTLMTKMMRKRTLAMIQRCTPRLPLRGAAAGSRGGTGAAGQQGDLCLLSMVRCCALYWYHLLASLVY